MPNIVKPLMLVTGFYFDADPARQGEFIECVRRNETNRWVGEIHLWIETTIDLPSWVASLPLLKSPKLRLVRYGHRVTFQDLFGYANRMLSGHRVVIANADIFFDDSLGELGQCELARKLFCLSRWDIQPDGLPRLFDHPSSQDAWIFEAPIRAFSCDFPLGIPGCDNRLAWEARQAGLHVSNPAKSVRALHLHLSSVRR